MSPSHRPCIRFAVQHCLCVKKRSGLSPILFGSLANKQPYTKRDAASFSPCAFFQLRDIVFPFLKNIFPRAGLIHVFLMFACLAQWLRACRPASLFFFLSLHIENILLFKPNRLSPSRCEALRANYYKNKCNERCALGLLLQVFSLLSPVVRASVSYDA